MTTSLIVGGRLKGKTSELVNWAAESPQRIVLCGSVPQARHTLVMAKTMHPGVPWDPDRFVSANRAIGMLRGRDIEVAVDDVEDVLTQWIGLRPSLLALSSPVHLLV